MYVADDRLLDELASAMQERVVDIARQPGKFPHQIVTVPDEWPSVQLAPLYDVHIGHAKHDADRFARHAQWIIETPNVLTWNGGDMIENASKLSVGSGVYEQDYDPQNQLVEALRSLARLRHKMIFALPGNHEARTAILGIDIAAFLGWILKVPYFPDYAFTTIRWRGNNFRILAHHGTGSAQTAGAQRMAARKDISWAKPFDLYWTGHLHAPLVDPLVQTDFDQRTGEIYERNGFVVISPSYLEYFGTYGARARYTPGARGLGVVTLNEDGRIDASLHANGRRL